MFSLSKRLIFGSDTKIDFKLSQQDGIARLYSERHIPYHDSKYWSKFLQLDTPTDVFSLLSLADLRRARNDAPENVVMLVRVMVAHLESLLIDPLFEPPPTNGSGHGQDGFATRLNGLADVTKLKIPGTSLMGFESNQNVAGGAHRDRAKEALNIVRILTRTLPAVMETDDTLFEDEVLWSQAPEAYTDSDPSKDEKATNRGRDSTQNVQAGKLDTSTQFVIDDDDEEEEKKEEEEEEKADTGDGGEKITDHPLASTEKAEESATTRGDDEPIPIALGERLVRLAVDLLFCSGFTLPWTDDQLEEAASTSQPQRINYSIWEAGVGSSVDLQGTTRSHVSNRVEVLRLLLVLLSKGIYIPAHKQSSVVDLALKLAVQGLDRVIMLPLLCSLINTSITNARNSTSAWLGLPSISGLVGGSNDEVRTTLVTMSLQILDILLTYDVPLPGESDTVSLSTVGRPNPGPAGRNVFRFYLSKLHRTTDFDFIWTGLFKSLNEHVNSTIQFLAIPIPTGGQGRRAVETSWQLSQVAERLVLLWRLLEHNHKFRVYVLDDAKRAPELLTILLYFSLTYKENVALQGLVRLCAFMLQDVSSERGFATNLAKPGSAARVQLPNRLGLLGGNTAIDFLVQGVYMLIATTKGQLSSLYAPLIITLSNTAPAWRSLSITASTRIIHLLRSFSQPSFLLSDEGHPRLLFYVLETINAVLTFGYDANVNLVYSLVLARGLVDALESFSLRKGVEEVWKRRRALGTDTTDWFEGVSRLEKAPLPSSSEPMSDPVSAAEEPGSGQDAEPSAVSKGKMRRISTSSTELASTIYQPLWEGELSKYPLEAVEIAAARYIAKSGFRPTQTWVSSWHQGLPLSTPRLVIDKLLPEVERIASGGGVRIGFNGGTGEITGGDTDARVLAYLREQKMSEYLPPPQGGIHPRGWQWTDQASVWLRSYLWGTIYVSGLLPYGLWSDTQVRLFRIHDRQDGRRSSSSQSLAQVQDQVQDQGQGRAVNRTPSERNASQRRSSAASDTPTT
ncbi:uncharacterized protein MEPE_05419 [Melanopsichium pennsylvanicum]|uniref:Protein HID1 n=2 Tax=Melanopsichium pennsylvanicum TaxID=63383 RepID=A0AAJ4XQM0_9BASI|nr:conserved hypothetical protein [Melanopsichium pennsylvanicum 4]SNX86710.1 uncharacterized protein MEPE_05419 [Melanopsichium pennsylvanicum]